MAKKIDPMESVLGSMLDILSEVSHEFDVNSTPYSVSDIEGYSLSDMLSKHLLKWRPWDTRMYFMQKDIGYLNRPSDLSVSLFENMKLAQVGRSDTGGVGKLELSICLNAKSKEFAEYNRMVDKSWDSDGEEDIEFDPATGLVKLPDNMTMFGGYAASLEAPSPHIIGKGFELPDINDRIRMAQPKVDWRVRAVVSVHMVLSGNDFVVGYQVVDKLHCGRILAVGSERGTDLSMVCQRVMHRMFGNLTLKAKEGDFYEGIRQLLSGEKNTTIRIAKRTDYSSFIGTVMTLSRASFWVGVILLVSMLLLSGFDFKAHTLYISIALMLGGTLVPMLLVPIFGANDIKAKARSIT